jgi:hypothetical protein
MLALAGEPAIYLQSFLAERNAEDLASETGIPRSINRRRFAYDGLVETIRDPTSQASRSIGALSDMLAWRAATGAFDARAPQSILDTPDAVVGIERIGPDGTRARVYVNVSADPVSVPTGFGESAQGLRAHTDGELLHLGAWGIGMVSSRPSQVHSPS